jgi:tRNA1Val (adenine37-N6)-methyltransferase
MGNDYFQFKQFTVWQQQCAMKVTTDSCLLGAWVSMMAVPANHPDEMVSSKMALLDIGTGTGLLSLMLAQKTTVPIEAVEIDPAAAEQARQNSEASPWGQRIRVITGDITRLLLPQQYTTIVSNPPFFENQLASPNLGRQKALHASDLSLAALLTVIDRYLHPQGTAFLMLPAYRETEITGLMVQHGLYLRQLVTVRHTSNHPPFRLLLQMGRETIAPIKSELIIRENDGGYSEAFKTLLKDYYLHF